MPEARFWLLTPREHHALRAQFERAHGVEPPLTMEQQQSIAMQKAKIHNAMVRKQKEAAEARRLRVVHRNG